MMCNVFSLLIYVSSVMFLPNANEIDLNEGNLSYSQQSAFVSRHELPLLVARLHGGMTSDTARCN